MRISKKIKFNKFTVITGSIAIVAVATVSISVPLILKKKNASSNYKSIIGQAAYMIMESIEIDPVGVASVFYDKNQKFAKLSFFVYFRTLSTIANNLPATYKVQANNHIILPTTTIYGPPPNTFLEDPSNIHAATVYLTITIDIKNKKLVSVESNQKINQNFLNDYLNEKIQKNSNKLEKAFLLLEKEQ